MALKQRHLHCGHLRPQVLSLPHEHLEVEAQLRLLGHLALLAHALEHRRRERQHLRRGGRRPRRLAALAALAAELCGRLGRRLQQHARDRPVDVALRAGGELLVHAHRELLRLLVLLRAQIVPEEEVSQLLVVRLLLVRALQAAGALVGAARRLEDHHQRVEQLVVRGRAQVVLHLAAQRERVLRLAEPLERHRLERLDERRVRLLLRGGAQLERELVVARVQGVVDRAQLAVHRADLVCVARSAALLLETKCT